VCDRSGESLLTPDACEEFRTSHQARQQDQKGKHNDGVIQHLPGGRPNDFPHFGHDLGHECHNFILTWRIIIVIGNNLFALVSSSRGSTHPGQLTLARGAGTRPVLSLILAHGSPRIRFYKAL